MAQYYEAIGRRKESTARVRLMDGSGTFTVNEKEAAVYFPRLGDLQDILRAFEAVGQEANKYDISVKGERRRCDRPDRSSAFGSFPRAGSDQWRLDLCLTQTWFAHPRRPGQGTQETRPKESPQGSYLHQALIFQIYFRSEIRNS